MFLLVLKELYLTGQIIKLYAKENRGKSNFSYLCRI